MPVYTSTLICVSDNFQLHSFHRSMCENSSWWDWKGIFLEAWSVRFIFFCLFLVFFFLLVYIMEYLNPKTWLCSDSWVIILVVMHIQVYHKVKWHSLKTTPDDWCNQGVKAGINFIHLPIHSFIQWLFVGHLLWAELSLVSRVMSMKRVHTLRSVASGDVRPEHG